MAVVEAVAAFVLLWFCLTADHRSIGPGGLSGILGVLLLLVIGLAQLVPLPSFLWRELPGRSLLASALELTARADASWPVSLDPQTSRDALLSFLPPVAMFIAVLHLGWADRRRLFLVLLAAGVASVCLGLLQVASGDTSFFNPYKLPPYGLAVGFFSNRDHQGLFMASCFAVTVAVYLESEKGRRSDGSNRPWTIGLLIAFAITALATASRSGAGLLALAVLGSLAAWQVHLARRQDGRSRLKGSRRRPGMVIGIVVGLALIVIFGVLLIRSYQFQRLVGRYAQVSSDARFAFWPDVLYVLKLYFPVGAGFGTFGDIYQSSEPLNELGPKYLNHAHNDYMELMIECGIAGAVLILIFFLWYGRRLWALWRSPKDQRGRALTAGAAAVILFVLLHSIVDYPMRTEAISCLFALCCGMLVAPVTTERRRRRRLSPGRSESLGRGEAAGADQMEYGPA
ncbi:MAG TPA: O-antigen ligase family protein [Sphingomonas sp.]|nr:O-antigen ligase family protein [Sphingomonas sp.]